MPAEHQKRLRALSARVSTLRYQLNASHYFHVSVIPFWGAAVLLVAWRLLSNRAIGIVAGFLLCAALAATWLLFSKRRVTQAQAMILADSNAKAGGLLLTEFETPVGAWEFELNQKIKSLRLPQVKLTRPALHACLIFLFVAAGFLVPIPKPKLFTENIVAQNRVEQLEEKLVALAAEEPMPEALQNEIERLKEELAKNEFDAADWEAGDQLEKQMQAQAQEAGEELAKADAAADSLKEALASGSSAEEVNQEKESLEQALMEASDGAQSEGAKALDDALKKAEQQNSENSNESSQRGDAQKSEASKASSESKGSKDSKSKSAQSNTPSQKQLSELKKALANRQSSLNQQFSPGKPNGASKPAQAKGKENGKGNSEGEGEGEGEGKDGTGKGKGKGKNGKHASRGTQKGGVGEGGESEELVFGGEAEIDPSRLKFEKLPEGNGGEAQDLLGLRAANPKVTEHETSAATGAFQNGDSAANYREGPMRPKNQALVEKYFQNQKP
jgi:chemotaxis protein histidine kinase CheA